MKKIAPVFTSSALFWDGSQQLSGTLILQKEVLLFEFDDFKHSHLNLQIQLSDIIFAKPFLIFKIAQKGLKIVSKEDKVDLFILEDSKVFYEKICSRLHEKK